MGMSLENGETFWPKNFREICFAPHKTQIPIRINPLYRSIHSYVQSLTLPWRFHKREITEETQRRKDITNFLSRTTTHFKRRSSTLYIFFLLVLPAFSILHFFPYLSANLSLFREINHISPLVSSIIPLSLHVYFCSIWLFVCATVVREKLRGEGLRQGLYFWNSVCVYLHLRF